MHAYVLVTVEREKYNDVFKAIDPFVVLAEGTEPGTDWQITAHIHKTRKSEIEKLHRRIRKIKGVTHTALAFEKPTRQKQNR